MKWLCLCKRDPPENGVLSIPESGSPYRRWYLRRLKFKLLDGNPEETQFAQTALFTKHPEMTGWPENHNFQIFKLEIEEIFLINWYGGPKPLTVDQYLQSQIPSSKPDKMVSFKRLISTSVNFLSWLNQSL
ncbi:uncharacterized protein LOC116011993 [Ipomoea triloba]|uniref:uncharacterized protein LOC116011993 n=1 Tax=Ipomoea triloba TaxID=35885 RepID=UPI00125D2C15|nr:uncharacterized protein LOC116011993 [Ipomoea triloba]